MSVCVCGGVGVNDVQCTGTHLGEAEKSARICTASRLISASSARGHRLPVRYGGMGMQGVSCREGYMRACAKLSLCVTSWVYTRSVSQGGAYSTYTPVLLGGGCILYICPNIAVYLP